MELINVEYDYEIKPKCKKSINKACKKNPVLKKFIENKIKEIIQNPFHYKSLRYELKRERRVHIMKSFVLKYEIKDNVITFIAFGHHDEVYEK